MDDILRTHRIEPEHLRNDDFEGFFNSRLRSLAALVSEAMGKPVVDERGSNEIEIDDLTGEADNEDEELQEAI